MNVSSFELMPLVKGALKHSQKVRLTVSGSSMIPFIYNGDIVELESIKTLRLGDIVLAEPKEGHYVIHRIVKVGKESLWLQGDAQTKSEGPILTKSALGKVTTVSHDGRIRCLEEGLWRVGGVIWAATRPAGAFLLSYLGLLRRIFRRFLKII